MAKDISMVTMEPMHVAQVVVKSDNPEAESLDKITAWAKSQDLRNYRLFGYDNCEPSPNHIYTALIPVPESVEAEGDVEIRDYPGGLYAVARAEGVEDIKPTWNALGIWAKNNGYTFSPHTELEELLTPVDGPPEEAKLDLYMPISR